MNAFQRWLSGVALVGVLLTGCASVSTDETWHEVQGEVAERTGRLVQWHRGGEADRAVAHAVDEMLRDGLTAEEAVQIALINNRDLQGTYEELGIAQADLVQAGLLKNPVFEGAFRFIRHDGQAYDLGVTQDFLDVLLLPLRKKVARSRLERVKLSVTAAAMDLTTEVRTAFLRAQAAGQMLAAQRTAMKAAEASYQMAQRLREAGNISALDLSLQRELYEERRLAVQSADLAVLEARERLNVLLGLWGGDTEWEITEMLPEVPAEPMDLSDLEKRTVGGSLNLAMAWQDLRTAAREMGVRVAEKVSPELAAGVEAEGEDPGVWEVGPMLALPIPLFDRGQAAKSRGNAQINRLWDHYTHLAVRVRSAARMARNRLLAARQRAVFYRDVVIPLREKILRQTQLRYNAMFLGVFQLLQARQLQTEARLRYVRELANYWIARLQMETLLQGRMVRGTATVPAMESAPASTGMNGGGH